MFINGLVRNCIGMLLSFWVRQGSHKGFIASTQTLSVSLGLLGKRAFHPVIPGCLHSQV